MAKQGKRSTGNVSVPERPTAYKTKVSMLKPCCCSAGKAIPVISKKRR